MMYLKELNMFLLSRQCEIKVTGQSLCNDEREKLQAFEFYFLSGKAF